MSGMVPIASDLVYLTEKVLELVYSRDQCLS